MSISVTASSSNLGGELEELLMAKDIVPGDNPSYQLCKAIYLYHPLGAKMVDAPLSMAQSQERTLTVQNNSPDEIIKEFTKHWEELGINKLIHNTGSVTRTYGLGSCILGCEGVPSDQPLKMEEIWDKNIFFNVLDPLNTSGSLVLNQIPTSPDFNKPAQVVVNGQKFHPSRVQVMMNESPVYIAYTSSAFGFVGRSVYQRALFPLKSFIRTMIADDMIATKLGLLIAKQKAPGSVISGPMKIIAALKRMLLRDGQTGNVLSIDVLEEIETLNMMNVDGAGTYARGNILKNIATSGDMPAMILENETLTEGFGEGTEDAKIIAAYVEGIRKWLRNIYAWFDNIVMYRAWSPEFFKRMQVLYPDLYGNKQYFDVFSEWRAGFSAEWPSLLTEPESELVEVDSVKFEALIATVQTLQPILDPFNQVNLIQFFVDNVSQNKRLIEHELDIDFEELGAHLEEQQEQAQESHEASIEPDDVAKKEGKFDAARARLDKLRDAVGKLAERRAVKDGARRAFMVAKRGRQRGLRT